MKLKLNYLSQHFIFFININITSSIPNVTLIDSPLLGKGFEYKADKNNLASSRLEACNLAVSTKSFN